MIRVLGVDPGLNTTGYAVIEPRPGKGIRLLEAGMIRSSAGTRKGGDLAPRLAAIHDGLVELMDQYAPTECAVEQLYAHYAHPRTAILMGHARGVILLVAGKRSIPVTGYTATRIKRSVTGSGRADKIQMQSAMMREFGLSAFPEPNDVADAMAVALTHMLRTRHLGQDGQIRPSEAGSRGADSKSGTAISAGGLTVNLPAELSDLVRSTKRGRRC